MDTAGNPVLLGGEEVIQTFDPIHADNILLQKHPYWEVVDDPRKVVTAPKESREKPVVEETVEEVKTTKKTTKKTPPKKRTRKNRS